MWQGPVQTTATARAPEIHRTVTGPWPPAGRLARGHVTPRPRRRRRSVTGGVPEVVSDGFHPGDVLVMSPAATGATSSWSDAGGVLGPTAFLLVGLPAGRERRVNASIAGPSSWRPHAPTKE